MLPSGDTSKLKKHKVRLKVKRWKMILQADNIHRKPGGPMLTPDKTDFRMTKVTRDEEGYFIMLKGTCQKDIILLDIYACNQGAPKYVKQCLTELNEETDKNTTIIGDFNTPLTALDRSSKQKNQ